MKKIVFLFAFIYSAVVFGQQNLPDFLQGNWKVENQNLYEHWDLVNTNLLKGFAYKIDDEKIMVTEYLEIVDANNKMVYTATVLNQNNGQPISFRLTNNKEAYVFYNPTHDFPKQIRYQKITENQVWVHVSDGAKKGFSYNLIKQK
ncbi:DUF6265 family protein [Flavobacterium agricola]|uniref:DUF6265 family protein n=1 Tax=Flavobacterium agricola TaxID=2870839 RepID=A0ABY6M465_9FLAO|nr:DUF6265 family protein [Flavobacterium agricola]UYW01898.1 DUF6265 family protein [Flavobacterium agricola]